MRMNNDYICINLMDFLHDMNDDDRVLILMSPRVDIDCNKTFEVL